MALDGDRQPDDARAWNLGFDFGRVVAPKREHQLSVRSSLPPDETMQCQAAFDAELHDVPDP